jgi:hypothetical protein
MSKAKSYWVYLHRDEGDQITYVGKGTGQRLLRSQPGHKGTRWVSGPYPNPDDALAVEAALISALSPQCGWHRKPGHGKVKAKLNNKIHSRGKRFAPLAVANHRASRYPKRVLTPTDLSLKAGGVVLVVLLTTAKLRDGRAVPDVIKGTAPDALAERAHKWWNLRTLLERCELRGKYPVALIAAFGAPESRLIVGSWRTRSGAKAWQSVDDPNREVPLQDVYRDDSMGIVGRRLHGLRFGQGSNAFCVIRGSRVFGPAMSPLGAL